MSYFINIKSVLTLNDKNNDRSFCFSSCSSKIAKQNQIERYKGISYRLFISNTSLSFEH